MSYAPIERSGQPEILQAIDAHIAERRDTQPSRRIVAFRATDAVLAARVAVSDPRMDDDEAGLRRKRQPFEGERPGVEKQRGAAIGQARGHLVHDPDRRADQAGFGAVRDARHVNFV